MDGPRTRSAGADRRGVWRAHQVSRIRVPQTRCLDPSRLRCDGHDESSGRLAGCCHDGAALEADAAILTVPPPVLPNIALPPAVREKAAVSTDIGFGNVVKILLRFTTKWWANRGGRDLADLTFLFSSTTV